MKEKPDYVRDLAEIRSMMERSSKFLSLSGWAGVMAGIYALVGAYIGYRLLEFDPEVMQTGTLNPATMPHGFTGVAALAVAILVLAVGTAIYLSGRNAVKRGEKLWNSASRQLLTMMAIPLIAGGLLILILINKGMIGLVAPFSLLFYGLALFNISRFTYSEVRSLGIIEIALGLFSSYYVEHGVLCWAIGFGVIHIIYGIYMHYKYEQ